jgi:glycosyltransferase involved in cell wall biosynthesis
MAAARPAGERVMRTVLHVLHTAQREAIGIARIAMAVATALAPRGFRSQAVFMDGDGPLVGWVRGAGVPADAVYWGGVRDLGGDVRVWRYLRRTAPDIVHQHFGGEYLRALIRAAGVRRIVAHFHDHGYETGRGAVVRHSTVFADAAIATSASVRAVIRGRLQPEIVYPAVVPFAAPAPDMSGRPPVIGALSRLAPVKGHIHLVRAMPALLARVPQARLEIAGEGPEAARLRSEAERLGVAGSVTWLGWCDDRDALFGRWRLFASPSLMEGFGLSILEAAMHGLPIVASRIGGIPELIEDGVSGCLVPPGDVDALAAALAGCLLDPPRAARLGEQAALRARTAFAPAQFDAAMRSLYARL